MQNKTNKVKIIKEWLQNKKDLKNSFDFSVLCKNIKKTI